EGPGGGVARERRVGGVGRAARALGVEGDDGIELRVQALDATEVVVEHLAARELATSDGGRQVAGGSERDVEHGHPPRSALAVPMTVTVPSVLVLQTSRSARWRAPSGTISRTSPLAVIVSPGHTTFTRRTSSLPPWCQPAPYRSASASATKQTDIMPCTTMSGKPSARAISRSVW